METRTINSSKVARQETSLSQGCSVQLFAKDRCKFTLATDVNNSMMPGDSKYRKPTYKLYPCGNGRY